jgi:hypothetical protein
VCRCIVDRGRVRYGLRTPRPISVILSGKNLDAWTHSIGIGLNGSRAKRLRLDRFEPDSSVEQGELTHAKPSQLELRCAPVPPQADNNPPSSRQATFTASPNSNAWRASAPFGRQSCHEVV